ncbi:hypothetical protein K437DRAFT_255248 [Tilletiaria anomala UBC 951]|uniref:Zf-UBP-domain-containing protein n=1 Tax=Tilletiaria anomala (strain ATCC 24038 / CBS 436.72 / UBC 951) TaxID=1037660 RepID=A0A066W6H0_TILAU|nr:uncharacterized protein K437DRAFT_255248 [Tilletiaria anomala UBC 951]KDN49572.1 hypothetical protein K437DRAFT_255248 [Tilletiaria anomala UBC 951]
MDLATSPNSNAAASPPTYRIHLALYDNSGPDGERISGTAAPPLSCLPDDWREALAELRQSGTYLVPPSSPFPPASPSVSRQATLKIFGLLPHVRQQRRRDRGGQLSDLPRRVPPAAAHADSSQRPQPPIDQRFGPIAIDWADHLTQSLPVEMSDLQLHSGGASCSSTSKKRNGARTAASAPIAQQPAQASTSSSAPRAPPASDAGAASYTHPYPRPRAASKNPAPSTQAQPETPTPVARFHQKSTFSTRDDEDGDRSALRNRVGNFKTGSTDVAFGVVHLFRDREEAMLEPQHESRAQDGETSASAESSQTLEDSELGTVLAVLAMPSAMTAADFLAFVEPAADAISHLRMIRETLPNRAMILLKFRDASDAEEFHKLFNGQPFNAMHPDQICQVVYVTSVTVSSSSSLPSHAFSNLTNSDPWPVVMPPSQSSTTAQSGRGSATTSDALAKGLLQELPTCPVCLERMDASVTGLMTITCQHTFHCSCLSKWTDSRCPVCRYSQTRQAYGHILARRPGEEDDESAPMPSACTVCATTTDLWVCLICASVGCGRYKSGHAHQHYIETGHLYSLELETQRVWDYAGDGYVHRLIQNKTDGKLVELPSASSTGNTPSGKGSYSQAISGEMVSSDKIESIGLEYSYLLTSQLESQRFYYEDKIHGLQSKLDDMVERDEALTSRVSKADAALAQLREEVHRTTSLCSTLEADRLKSENRAGKAVEQARKLQRDLQAEQSISQGLQKHVEILKEEGSAMKSKVVDLEEQMRDLMFFVSAREKVQGSEELVGGDVAIGPPAKGKKKKGGK